MTNERNAWSAEPALGPRLQPERLINLDRARRSMESEGVDLVLATTPENAYYVTGTQSSFQWTLRGVKTAYYGALDSSGEISLIAPGIELDNVALENPPVDRIIPYQPATLALGDPASWSEEDRQIAALAVAESPPDASGGIDALGSLKGLRVAVDDPEMGPELANRGAEVLDGRPLLAHIRRVKTGAEVDRLRTAVRIVEAGMKAAIEAAEEGISERELAFIFESEVLRCGGRPYQTIIGFGHHSAYPTRIPSDARLEEGDLIRFDCGCMYGGHVSDIARTAVLGDVDTGVMERWKAVKSAQSHALEAARAGHTAKDVYGAAMAAAREAGLPLRRRHVGHGIGIDMYEAPLLSPSDDTTLQDGMVVDVEVPYYELGLGGLVLEDTVHITGDGLEIFNELPHQLFQAGAPVSG